MAADREPPEARTEDSTISVMDWLVSIGNVVARKLRGAPSSPMAPLHRKS